MLLMFCRTLVARGVTSACSLQPCIPTPRFTRASLRVMAKRNETEEERAARKAAQKAAKAEKRAQRSGEGSTTKGQKECTLCSRPRDLLVRCQVDATGRWQMACGKCWLKESGGQVDGVLSVNKFYKYGGLWKNHHAKMTGKHKVPKGASGKSINKSTTTATPIDAMQLQRQASTLEGLTSQLETASLEGSQQPEQQVHTASQQQQAAVHNDGDVSDNDDDGNNSVDGVDSDDDAGDSAAAASSQAGTSKQGGGGGGLRELLLSEAASMK